MLLGPSEVSGWGLFTKNDLKKGDFIQEYCGELVSQNEADRRGLVDDVKNRSYLFNLSSDHVLDASNRGGKARFINHSGEPNCEPRVLFVNGEQRIGFFAKQDIKAETELLFNYRYNESIINEYIEKPPKTVEWTKEEEEEPKAKPKKKTKKRRRSTQKHYFEYYFPHIDAAYR